jgi:nitroimidazol reductase NimA-like FMN-containing flavoprotein (pyridoxamine 5'-phosphate oxidase superfamily)
VKRKDREMDTDFALDVVDKCEYAVLALFATDGFPYCLPITIARDGDHIYFHGSKEGKKIEALRRDPHVCLACVGDTQILEHKFTTEFESAIVFGLATEVTEKEEKLLAMRLLCQRHTPSNMSKFAGAAQKGLPRTAIWRIDIQEITGKRKKYDREGKEMKFGRTEQC